MSSTRRIVDERHTADLARVLGRIKNHDISLEWLTDAMTGITTQSHSAAACGHFHKADHAAGVLFDISTFFPQRGTFKFSHPGPFPSINVLEACSSGAPSFSSSQASRFSHRFARFAMMRHLLHAIWGTMKPSPWRPPAANLGSRALQLAFPQFNPCTAPLNKHT